MSKICIDGIRIYYPAICKNNLLLMFRTVDQVVYVVEICLVVVELLGHARPEKAAGDRVGLSLAMILFPGGRRRSFPKISQVLPGRREDVQDREPVAPGPTGS